MTSRRWDEPWAAPVGSAPERPAGEPTPGQLALLHLGVLLALGVLGTAVGLVSDSSSDRAAGLSALVLWLVAGGVGAALLRRRTPWTAWASDLLLVAAAGYLFAGVSLLTHDAGLSSEGATLAGSLAALAWTLPAYVVHRRVWLQAGVVLSAAGALLAGLAMQPSVPDAVGGAYLLVLAGFLALTALSGLARPVRSGFVLAALLATAGAHVVVGVDALAGSLVALVLLALVAVGVVKGGNRSLLPVTVVAGVVLLPSVLEPLLGLGRAAGVSLALVAAGAAWLAVDLVRRSPRAPHVGGVFAVCLLGVLASYPFLLFHTEHDGLADLAHALAVTAFFGAAAAGRRRPATVVSGLLVVLELPGALAFHAGQAAQGVAGLFALGGVIAAAVVLGRRAPGAAAAAHHQDVALSGQGREWTVVSPYPVVFDAAVGVLGAAGVPLQLVDRASGRVVAGDALAPLLVVAIWADDPVRTRLRAVGAPADVDLLEADVARRLGISLEAPR